MASSKAQLKYDKAQACLGIKHGTKAWYKPWLTMDSIGTIYCKHGEKTAK